MFSAGQVEPVNAAVCNGYTDPSGITTENNCRSRIGFIERIITTFCSGDNENTQGCEMSDGVPSLVRNLPPYDELPQGIRDIFSNVRMSGRNSHQFRHPVVWYSAITKGKAPVFGKACDVWAGIIESHLNNGGRLSDLEDEVNVGYFVDPLLGNRYRNDPIAVELQEVLEYAYKNPDYYPLLHENGFPIPFAMDDFDPGTEQDDADRRELQRTVDRIKRELRREWRGIPQDSDAIKRELAKRIFDWLMDWKTENRFESDIENEYQDYESYRLKRGDCTELSAILYFLYTEAGLEPSFFLSTDFEPQLMMLNVLDIQRADHALVGVPLTAGAMMMVDPMNELFDTNYVKAIKVTPRQFVAGTLRNRVLEGIDKKDDSMANDANQIYLRLAPESIEPYDFGLETNMLDPMRSGIILSEMARKLAGHPLAHFVSARARWIHSYLSRDDGIIDRATASLSDALVELEAQDSNLAAYAHNKISASYKITAANIRKGRMPLVEGRDLSNIVEECEEKSFFHLKRSATLDPNNLFVLGDLVRIFNHEGKFDEGAEFFEALAATNPSHSISRYLAGRFRFFRAVNSDNPSDLMGMAIEHANRLISIEPQSPIPYSLLALYNYYLSRENETRYYWERAKSFAERSTSRTVRRHLWNTGLFLGWSDDILSFAESMLSRSIYLLLARDITLEGVFNGNERFMAGAQNTFDIVKTLIQRLDNLPDISDLEIDFIDAKFSSVLAVIEGREEMHRWSRFTGTQMSRETQEIINRVFITNLVGYANLLLSDRPWDVVRLGNIEDHLSMFEADPNSQASLIIARTYIALASRYARIGNWRSARDAFEKARRIDARAAREALDALPDGDRLRDVLYVPPYRMPRMHERISPGP